jgi:metal-dependent HD superfamily phosphatase/phosphodiesterase
MNENTLRGIVVLALKSTITDLENNSLTIEATAQRLADIADMLAATVEQEEARVAAKL